MKRIVTVKIRGRRWRIELQRGSEDAILEIEEALTTALDALFPQWKVRE